MLAADLHGVAKARRGEERRQRALALDQRVGHQGRAMNQRAALTGFYRAVFQRRPECILDGQTRIARSGKRLADHCCAVVADQQHVGEGSADIDTYTVHDSKTVSRSKSLGSSLDIRGISLPSNNLKRGTRN
jgi:predicted SnoaL-like aldol condensation-catalyzing enzyme